MLSPLLIIGVGGAGGKTIRAMKQELNRILESSGYTGGIPDAWQFLQIDTTIDGEGFPAPMLSSDEMHRVVPNGASYADVLAGLKHGSSLHEQQKMFAGWGIPAPAISINNSLSQYRAIGRLVIVADAGKTLQAMQASISKMKAPSAMTELANIAHVMGSSGPYSQPQAFIVSSLCGGSGSGMYMDVAELLKSATSENWGHESISFLYTPEVFRSIGGAGNSLSKNTFGAMNELMASQWVGKSDRSDLLYSKKGLAVGSSSDKEGFGCRSNVLIGPRNGAGIDIRSWANNGEGMNEAFLNVGTLLAGVVSNDDTYEFLIQSLRHKAWHHHAVDISGLASEDLRDLTGASSIGFGQMTLGADRIVDYVADALTKSQVEKLLWPDFSPELVTLGKSKVDLIEEESNKIWPDFLFSSGLDEAGDADQIVDSLRDKELSDKEIAAFCRKLIKDVLDSGSSGSAEKAMSLRDFQRRVYDAWEDDAKKTLKEMKEEVDRKAQAWVPGIQKQMRNLCADELNRHGFLVLSNLVTRLQHQLIEKVTDEFSYERDKFAKAVQNFDRDVFNTQITELAGGLSGVSKSVNWAFLEKSVAYLSNVLKYQIKSYSYGLAVNLILDLNKYFLEPLLVQLSDARLELSSEIQAPQLRSGQNNSYLEFPTWGTGKVPPKYLPRTIERILIDPENYESTYDLYASRDSGGAAPFPQSVSASLLGKKMNPMPGDPNMQSLITVNNPWITSIREAQGTEGIAASKSKWNFHTGIEELAIKNRRWLRDSESSFGNFTNLSIRDYVTTVNADPQIRAAREFKFVSEFEAMLATAQPLMDLNPNAMKYILSPFDGGYAGGILSRTSKIPFSANSDVGRACKIVLEKNGYDSANPGFEQDWFDAGRSATNMFVVSIPRFTLPAWAFASLTEPILEQVAQSHYDPRVWIAFWEGRRSRPLIEAIPFETEMRRSIITGWFVATLFGMRKVTPLPTGRTVQIWNPTLETPDWSTFPSPLLATHHEDSQRGSWVLPQLLMSAGIALANFGKTGDTKNIEGYRFLLYLGREVTTSMRNRDQWNLPGSGDLLPTGERSRSQYLKNWVESGESPYLNEELLKELQISLALSPDRAEALIKTVQLISAEHKSIWDTFSETSWHSLPETWELKEDIDLALKDIAAYIIELGSSSSSTIA